MHLQRTLLRHTGRNSDRVAAVQHNSPKPAVRCAHSRCLSCGTKRTKSPWRKTGEAELLSVLSQKSGVPKPDGGRAQSRCNGFCPSTMPSTITSIYNAIWSPAELSIKPAPRHSLNGSKLCLL